MTTEEDTIFWKKKDDNELGLGDSLDLETWDDNGVVYAYDRAVATLIESNQTVPLDNDVVEVKGTKQKKKKRKSKNADKKWKIGGQCLAIFSEDGLYYEAIILATNYTEKTVDVKFIYYGNEEEVNMTNLLPMERKAELKAESINKSNGFDQLSSEDTYTADNKSKRINNWHVSDICYVLNKNGAYQQAVINCFKSSDTCYVTIVKSNKKREVKISQLYSCIPSQHKKCNKESRSRHSSDMNGFHSDIPMFIPPPPPMPLCNSGLPNPPPFTNNSYKSTNIPKCPPIPVIPDNIISGDEEALANMLMSWYISGFHTGYYQGMQKYPQNYNYHGVNGHRDERKTGSRWDKTLV